MAQDNFERVAEKKSEYQIPKDFPKRFGTKIFQITNMPEMIRSDLSKNIAEIVNRNIRGTEMYEKFMETFEYLLDNYPIDAPAAILFEGFVDNRDTNADHKKQFKNFIGYLVKTGKKEDQKTIRMGNATFSYNAAILCRIFDEVLRNSSNQLFSISKLYAEIISTELMFIDFGLTYRQKSEDLKNEIYNLDIDQLPSQKYLFKDIFDICRYIVNEKKYAQVVGMKQIYASNLLEKISKIVEYETGLIISKKIQDSQALEKIDERRRRSCTPNELENAEFEFVKAVELYRQNTRYIYQFVALEDLRNFMIYIGIILGFMVLIFGFFNYFDINLLEGLVVFGLMMIHSKMVMSQKIFRMFHTPKPGPELEIAKRVFMIYFVKMTQSQLNLFLNKIIKKEDNIMFRNYYIDFLQDVYSSTPNKENMLFSKQEFLNTLQIVNTLIFEI